MAFPIALASAGLGILGKGVTGIFQGAKANKLDKANPFVKEELSPELKANLADAEMNANNGLASSVYNKAEQDIGRGTSTYLRAFGKSGRAGSLLSAIRGQNDALLNLNVADANAVERNRNTLRGERRIMAGENARLWNVNVRQPYEKVQKRISDLRSASSANIGGAFESATQLGATMGGNIGGGGNTPNQLGTPAGFSNQIPNSGFFSQARPVGF